MTEIGRNHPETALPAEQLLQKSEIKVGDVPDESEIFLAIDNATNSIQILEEAQKDPVKLAEAMEFVDTQLPVLYTAYEHAPDGDNKAELLKKIRLIAEMQAHLLEQKKNEDLAEAENAVKNA
jgi:hypothetical protein